MKLAAALLLLVFLGHYVYEPLATWYPDAEKAARAWFYVLRGFESSGLYLLIAILAALLSAVLKRWGAYPSQFLACMWGLVESLETSVCRLAYGIENSPPPVSWRGLCDDVTGLPTYAIGIASGACLAAYMAVLLDKRYRHG